MAGMKDAIMYSTLDGAKKCAKQLKHILERSGLAYPLAKCQAAVACAGGYDDWHDLSRRIGQRTDTHLPYDYWGGLIRHLPEPCHLPVRSYLRDDLVSELADASTSFWVRDTLPYLVSLEIIHRTTSSLLRPGSGKDQKMRLQIVSGILLDIEKQLGFTPKFDPVYLTAILDGAPHAILPALAKHPRFSEAVKALIAAGILRVDDKVTCVLAPESEELRVEIVRRARSWNVQKEPEIKYVSMSVEASAVIQRQSDIDREEAGPKTAHDQLDYRGVLLQSRFSVASEFKAMEAVVDSMPEDVRLRVASIWCDSKAGSFYRVVVTLGMNHSGLAREVREAFLSATSGFNGIIVVHGSHDTWFDPEWPAEEAYLAELYDDPPSSLN